MHARLLYKIELQKSRQRKYCWANRLTINVMVHGRRVVGRGGAVVRCAQHVQGLCSFYILQILKKNLFNETIILFLKQFQVNFMRKDCFPIVVKY